MPLLFCHFKEEFCICDRNMFYWKLYAPISKTIIIQNSVYPEPCDIQNLLKIIFIVFHVQSRTEAPEWRNSSGEDDICKSQVSKFLFSRGQKRKSGGIVQAGRHLQILGEFIPVQSRKEAPEWRNSSGEDDICKSQVS